MVIKRTAFINAGTNSENKQRAHNRSWRAGDARGIEIPASLNMSLLLPFPFLLQKNVHYVRTLKRERSKTSSITLSLSLSLSARRSRVSYFSNTAPDACPNAFNGSRCTPMEMSNAEQEFSVSDGNENWGRRKQGSKVLAYLCVAARAKRRQSAQLLKSSFSFFLFLSFRIETPTFSRPLSACTLSLRFTWTA